MKKHVVFAGFCRLLPLMAMLAVSPLARAQVNFITPPVNTPGDLISGRNPNAGVIHNNSWTLSTPDDEYPAGTWRTQLYLAPARLIAGGGSEWNWSVATQFMASGDIRASRDIFVNGRVGIGVEPSSMSSSTGTVHLGVNGKIGCQGVYVKTAGPWPDFVFAPDYRLRPLTEVGQFIQANCHLPDVPSAAEVAKDGIELADIDARLLRKIEELTLYLLEQQRENAALRARVETLERATTR
jgi:hypothetical protein